MDWLDLLTVQGTLKSPLQLHSSKSIHSSVLSFLYSPTLTSIHDHWKNHSPCWKSLSGVQLFVTPWTAARHSSLSLTIFWSFPKFMSSVMPSNHLILCCPLLLLPSIFPSFRVFSNESVLHIRWPKLVEIQLQHEYSASSEYSGLISFRIDWFDLLAVQGAL